MAETVAEIAVRVGADVSQLTKGLKKADSKVRQFGKKAAASSKNIAKIGAASAVAGLAIGTHLVKQSLAAIDAQAKLARQIGTTSKSLATLTRAGELSGVSINAIKNAALKLEVNAGKAQQGLLAQADAFEAMGLSARDVMALPLEERFIAINDAIANNVDKTEQAAVAADLFGAKNASLLKMMNTDVIKKAAEETELYGLALSEIDAAKVEAANDSFSGIKKGAEGLFQQITVELAPAIGMIGEEFKAAIKEAGGMDKIAGDAVNGTIEAIGKGLDAVHSFKVGWSVMANGAIIAFAQINKGFNLLLNELEQHSGIFRAFTDFDIEKSTQDLKILEGVVAQATDSINAKLAEPKPSEGLKLWVAEAKAAAEEVAKLTGAEKDEEEGDTGDSQFFSPADKEALAKKIEAIRQAALTENQILEEKLAERMRILSDAGAAEVITKSDQFAEELIVEEEHANALIAIAEKAAKQKRDLENGVMKQRLQAGRKALGDLSTLMSSESKSQFETGKKAAIAGAAIDTIKSAQGAYAALASIPYVGPFLGAAAAAAAIAAGNARVSQIKSQSFGGGGNTSGVNSSVNVPYSPAGGGDSGGGGESSRNIYVQGIDSNQMFSGAQLVDLINSAQEDGAQLRVA